MLDQTLRARSVTELVDAAFSLYRRDGTSYIMVTALASVPSLIGQLLLMQPANEPSIGASLAALGLTLLSLVTYALMTGVVTRMGSDVYLGGEADVQGAVKAVLPRVGSLIGAGIMRGILYVVFFLLLFFPIFYAFARWFAPEPVVVLEGKNAGDAMTRSSELSEGLRMHIFGTLLLGYAIYLALAFGVGALAGMTQSQLVVLFAQTAFTVVAYPIVGLLTMLLYYDARIRKEGFDVEHMSRVLAAPMAPPAR